MTNKYCPICGRENKCMMTEEGEASNHCWCTVENFPKEIFEVVPEEYLYKHCICKNCLDKFKASHQVG